MTSSARTLCTKFFAIVFVLGGFLFMQNIASAAVSYVGASNLIATNGSAPGAITPNASTATGDLLVFYHYSRATTGNETVTLPTGFTSVFNSVTANRGLVAVGWRVRQAGDTTYTASVTNHSTGGTGETILEWIETYRGTDTVNPIVDFTPNLSAWTSSLNMGPIAAPTTATVADGDTVVVFGGRFENTTAQTTLTGDNLTWTARTRNDTTQGSDASAVTQTGLNSSGTNQTVTTKTITTTGTAQAGAGRMFIIKKVPPSATLSASPTTCTILSGASTCTVPFTWSITNATSPNLYNSTTATQYSTSASGSGVSYAITNGSNTVQARDSSTVLASTSVTASCTSGTSWNGSSCAPTPAVPTVTSPTASAISTSTVTLGATVTSLGVPASISSRGTCLGTTPAPTNCSAEGGTTTGTFTQNWIGLTPGTQYYYRGYATNSTGTGYSSDGTFTSLAVPTVTSPTVTGITTAGATLGANVTSLGVPASISARGTCWGTSSSPLTNCTAEGGTTTGVFTHARTGMSSNTFYYYRGYATNSTGTGYSSDGTFTTTAGASGSVSASPTTCTILSGASSCTVPFTWSISNAISPNLYNATTATQYSTSASGSGVSFSITNGSNTVQARDSSTVLASTSVTASCTSGTSWNGSSCTAAPTTTIADGSTPSSMTIAPGAGATDLDYFTLQTSSGSDTITAVTVTLSPTGAFNNIAQVDITDNSNVTKCTSVTNPSSNTVTFSSCSISVTTSATTYKIRITPKSHANMPPVPGASYGTTGTVTSFTSSNGHSGADSTSATVTIDNLSPGDATAITGSTGSTHIVLDWTNPSDTDYGFMVILRRALSAITDIPTEGATYTAGNTIGSSIVACVIATPTTTCDDIGLTNGTAYYYKLFAKDTNGNYSSGAIPTGVPFTPQATTFNIVASSGANGSVTPSGTTAVSQGGSQTYDITPNSGYTVATLLIDSVSVATSTTYTFTNVQAAHTISATFSILATPTFNIVASSGANGTVTPTGTTVVTQGSSQAYNITPDGGYGVATLVIDSVSVATSTTYTFTNVQAAHTISATFSLLPVTHTITSSTGSNGTITPLGATTVSDGSSQTFNILPDSGFTIEALTVDSVSIATSTSYTFNNVITDHTISATFALIPPPPGSFTIVANQNPNGTVSPPGSTVVTQGASQTYNITPDSGYYIDTLIIDSFSVATSTSYAFTNVQADHTIEATFAAVVVPPGSFSIVSTAGANGSISPSGTTVVTQAASQAYSINPNSGYDVATLSIDGSPVATSTSYTFTNVQAGHTIDATFSALPAGSADIVSGPRLATIVFFGRAFPGANISIIDKNLGAETTISQKDMAKVDGGFEVRFRDLLEGAHSFALLVKDPEGRTSQTKFFLFNARDGDEVFKDILVPPTLDVVHSQVSRGDSLKIFGYAALGHTIRLYLDGILIKEKLAGNGGLYSIDLPTGALEFGQHTLKAKQINILNSGVESDFSTTKTFIVSKLGVVKADLNGDGKIDIKDWSIFLSRWGSKNSIGRMGIDLNNDGKVDLTDFSIFIKTIRK